MFQAGPVLRWGGNRTRWLAPTGLICGLVPLEGNARPSGEWPSYICAFRVPGPGAYGSKSVAPSWSKDWSLTRLLGSPRVRISCQHSWSTVWKTLWLVSRRPPRMFRVTPGGRSVAGLPRPQILPPSLSYTRPSGTAAPPLLLHIFALSYSYLFSSAFGHSLICGLSVSPFSTRVRIYWERAPSTFYKPVYLTTSWFIPISTLHRITLHPHLRHSNHKTLAI